MHDLVTLQAGGYRGTGLSQFRLTGAPQLDTFPEELFALGETLELLDLSGTQLSTLPANLGARLPRLRIAFFSGCRFARFPRALAACPQLETVAFRRNGMVAVDEDALPATLRWLILTENALTTLPASIGQCVRLEKCMLAGNRLTTLPPQMAQCRNLTLLRLAANRLAGPLPAWLLALPKLAFMSFAGNPCARNFGRQSEEDGVLSPAAGTLPHIDWDQIEIDHVLGQGASGVISKGTVRSTATSSRVVSVQTTPALSGASTPDLSVFSSGASTLSVASSSTMPSHVAVKVFRGALTSDGTPYDEMAACLAAGQHVNLVQVHGQIRWNDNKYDNDDDAGRPVKGGLVMDLIPPAYNVLGQPPSFASCTRDCFADDARGTLAPTAALAILADIADAAAHLHGRGIAHGDLYAHNILVRVRNDPDEHVHAILSDFGAATLYGRESIAATNGGGGGGDGENNEDEGRTLEKIEVLAFAHLVEDVLGLMVDGAAKYTFGPTIRDALQRLHGQCSVATVGARPTFADVAAKLRRTT